MCAVHLKKLSVGSDSIKSLLIWQEHKLRENGAIWHDTRHFPKRKDELLDGGSIYWIIKGKICCRQNIDALEPIADQDGKRFCRIILAQKITPTLPLAHRVFQGWRYLSHDDAPADITGEYSDNPHINIQMQKKFYDMGLM